MWPDHTETKNLLREAENGTPEAIDRLLGRHRESLRKMVSYHLDPKLLRRLDASDIVQDVLIEATRRFGS